MLSKEVKMKLRFRDYKKSQIKKEQRLMKQLPQLKRKEENKLKLKMRELDSPQRKKLLMPLRLLE